MTFTITCWPLLREKDHQILFFFNRRVYSGDDSTADVVPHAEDGAGDGGHGIGSEMECGQRRGEARVLHAYLDGYC